MAFSSSKDLEININITRTLSNLSLQNMAVIFKGLEKDLAFFENPKNTVKSYGSLTDLGVDFDEETRVFKAGKTFFSQSNHPQNLYIANLVDPEEEIYYYYCDVAGDLENFQTTASHFLRIAGTSGGDAINATRMDFSEVTSYDEIAEIIEDTFDGSSAPFSEIKVFFEKDRFVIQTKGEAVEELQPSTGQGIEGEEFLNGEATADTEVLTIEPGGQTIEEGLNKIEEFSGDYIYGYVFSEDFSEFEEFEEISDYFDLSEYKVAGITARANTAYSQTASTSTDIGLRNDNNKTKNTILFYTNQGDNPSIAVFAEFLSISYSTANSSRTAKFLVVNDGKVVDLSTTNKNTLDDRKYNYIDSVANNTYSFIREGKTTDNQLIYIDLLFALDNIKKDLIEGSYNLLTQSKKIEYTEEGIAITRNALNEVLNSYVNNNTLDSFVVNMPSIDSISEENRNNRILAPIDIEIVFAGAIHKIVLNITGE